MKSLHDCGDDWEDFLRNSDDVWIFKKGACHAFALELLEDFQERGHQSALYYACNKENQTIARHVFVAAAEFYWDVSGCHTATTIAKEWCDGEQARILPVGHPGWISLPKHTPQMSFLALRIDPEFMRCARERARAYIKANPDCFEPREPSPQQNAN